MRNDGSRFCGECLLLSKGWKSGEGNYFVCSLYKKHDAALSVKRTNFGSTGNFVLVNERMEVEDGKPLKRPKCLKRDRKIREASEDDKGE